MRKPQQETSQTVHQSVYIPIIQSSTEVNAMFVPKIDGQIQKNKNMIINTMKKSSSQKRKAGCQAMHSTNLKAYVTGNIWNES